MTQNSDELIDPYFCMYGIESDHNFDDTPNDVVFIINAQLLKALKSTLIDKNNVFKAMFSGNFKESKDNEVVIEGTTFEAFKALILWLYYNQLILKDYNDLELIEEVYKLSDRYECPELHNFIVVYLLSIAICYENLESIAKIAFNYQMKELIEKVSQFVDNNFNDFVNKVIIESQDMPHNRLLKVLVTNYRKISRELIQIKYVLDKYDQGLSSNGSLFTHRNYRR